MTSTIELLSDASRFVHRKISNPDDFVGINWIPNARTFRVGEDSKIFKEIIVPGHEEEIPHDGVEVQVHYSGYLANGQAFGSSAFEKPVEFILGQVEESKHVCRGWHKAVSTMRKGEVSLFILHPDEGFRQKKQGIVPPNSTLYFELTLVDWKGDDVSSPDYPRWSITRKMVMPGPDKFVLPNDRARVIVYLEGALASKPHFPFDRRRVSFTLGEGVEANVCGGIESALFHFKCGETSKLTIEPIAFGLNKLFRIPENEKVIYRVHLQSVDRALEVWEMQGPEKLEIAKKFRDKGNEYFKREQYRVACRFYKRIVEFLMAEASLESESETERKSLISIAYLSQAQTYLKLGENEKALHAAEDGITYNPKSEKGHFRKGLAHMGLNDPQSAVLDFEKVLEINEDNRAARTHLLTAKNKVRDMKEKDKAMLLKMMGGIAGIKELNQKPPGPGIQEQTSSRSPLRV